MSSIISYITPLVPHQIRLELTSKCNAKCLTCHRSKMTRPLGDMSWELLMKCLEDVKDFPQVLSEVVLSNYGETFMYPQWYQAMELTVKILPHTPIVLPTNGTFLTEETVNKLCLIPTLKLVNVSVNAFLPETYRKFHSIDPKAIEVIKSGITRVRQLRPDITIWVSMAYDYLCQSPREVELFREFWSQYGIVQVNTVSYAGVKGKEPLIPVSLPCRSIFSDMVIAYNGDVSSCCFDVNIEVNLGNANETNLLDIWNSSKFAEFRRKHNEGKRAKFAICSKCSFA